MLIGSDASTSQALSVIGSGQTYTFSGYAKRSGTQWAGIGINYYDGTGAIISQQNLPITSANYAIFSLSVTAPANAETMAVWANNTVGGQLYLDALTLIIDPNPPSPTSPPDGGSIFTFNPVADAAVVSNRGNNNYGSLLTLDADSSPIMNSYLRFDIQGLDGAVVTATLRLYSLDTSSVGIDLLSVADNS